MYLVTTSDGEVHEFITEDEAVDCIDLYGPEVVDSNLYLEDDRQPCGCYVDYHSADCPRLTDRHAEPWQDENEDL